MLNQQEQVAKFFDAINQDAEDRHEELNRQNRDMLNLGLKKAGDKARAKANAMIAREVQLNEQELNRTVAKNTVEKRAMLNEQRAEITQKVFDSARDKLLAFTLTDAYVDFLKKSAAEFSKAFVSGEVVIYVKEEDKKYASAIAEAFGRECTVETDSSIVIGGCRCKAEGGRVMADDTLESRLEAQKEWFLGNSGMSFVL